jgi:signal transduction histidine kinase
MMDRRWGGPRVTLLSDEPALRANVLATIAATLPGVAATAAGADDEARLTEDEADAVVVDGGSDVAGGLSLVRRARARGFGGGAVVLTDGSDAETPPPLDLPDVRLVSRSEMMRMLPAALLDVLHRDAPPSTDLLLDTPLDALALELRRVQRLLVAGEAAVRLPHALNNPLGALLAEAQLLRMHALDAEEAESVDRIIALCRRMASIVRGFEEVIRA